MSSKKLNYLSIGKTVDGTTFCSGVETLAENIIEDNEQDSVLTFPSSTEWASMRSSSYRMTSDNVEAHLPLPIYKIKSVKVKLADFDIKYDLKSYKYTEFKDENGNSPPLEFDITQFVVNKKEWEALPLANSTNEYLSGIYKDNTFYWDEGDNKIPFLSTVYKIGLLIFADETTTYYRVLRSAIRQIKNIHSYKLQDIAIGGSVYDLYLYDAVGNTSVFDGMSAKIQDWQFRIEYVPVSSKTKIRARKNAPTQQEYIQPFNQRAEINAASAFGKNMWLTAQKTGCKQIKIVKNYTRLKDIPPLGALVRHNGRRYRLVANHYVQTNTVYLQVTHTLSENWTERSKHVAVDQKYRNWSIPQETLWRNLYWEDYLRVGSSIKDASNASGGVDINDIMELFTLSGAGKTIDTFAWYPADDLGTITIEDTEHEVKGVTVPCSTYGIANSLIFSASFKDNLSAGLRANEWAKKNDKGEISYTCEEALYCKADGTVSTARVSLGEGIKNYNSVCYPSVCEGVNLVENEVFNKEFFIYKDPGEALKFTYQIHLIGEDDCFFGNKFAEHNTLIKKWGDTGRQFRVWLLTHYIRDGIDVLETTTGDWFSVHSLSSPSFSLGTQDGAKTLTLSEAVANTLAGGGYFAWAITDEKNNLYVACNDVSVKTLYFQLHHKR